MLLESVLDFNTELAFICLAFFIYYYLSSLFFEFTQSYQDI
jgi:hypothetical protein